MESEKQRPEIDTREQLLLAGIEYIEKNGIEKLSMRQLASSIGLSCAAPYKHYKNKNEFIVAIIRYIKDEWNSITKKIALSHENKDTSTREILTEISIEYIRFLVEHPSFRAIILMNDENLSPEQAKEKNELSERSRSFIMKYCSEVGMSEEDRIRKTFIVRSIIYGASLMMDSGEIGKADADYEMVKDCIRREFDIK